MSVDGYPVADPLPALEMLVVHMIESFVPRFETLLLQCDDLHTEAAPELTLSVAAYASALELFLDGVIAHLRMVLFEMLRKFFTAVEDLRAVTDLTAGIRLVTPPAFELEMLRVLVTFPVVLAAEDLVASLKGAAVGLGVPLLVLPVGLLDANLRLLRECTYFISQDLARLLGHMSHCICPPGAAGWLEDSLRTNL